MILDVVYNHLGPDGNYLDAVLRELLHRPLHQRLGRGDQLRRRGLRAGARALPRQRRLLDRRVPPRRPAARRDAGRQGRLARITSSPPLARRAREAAGERSIYVVAENEPQDTRLVRPPAEGGYGLDALWNDDFHHSTQVALTGRNEAYYTRLPGSPQEMISLVKYGYLYQGQRYSWQEKRRGTSALGLPPSAFVNFLQNHDQVANSARGERCHRLAEPRPLPGADRAAAARRRERRCSSRGRSSAPPARSSTSPTTTRSWRARCARGARVPLAVPQPGPARDAGGRARPGVSRELRALQARLRGAAAARRLLRPAPGPAAAAPGGPGLPRPGRRVARRRGARAGGVRAPLLRRERRTTACCSSTSAGTWTSSRCPSRCWRPWPACAGRCSGRAKIRATAAAAHRRRRIEEGCWRLPGQAAVAMRLVAREERTR